MTKDERKHLVKNSFTRIKGIVYSYMEEWDDGDEIANVDVELDIIQDYLENSEAVI